MFLRIFLFSLASVLLAATSEATILYGDAQPTIPNTDTTWWEFTVHATDGITGLEGQTSFVGNDVQVTIEPVGVIQTFYRVDGMDLLSATPYSTTIDLDGFFDVMLDISSAFASKVGSGTLLNAGASGFITAGFNGFDDGYVTGSLTVPGGTLPINLGLPSTGVNKNMKLSSDLQLLQIASSVPNARWSDIPLGTVEGIDYSITVFAYSGNANLTIIPEPTTASLLALGLIGIAAGRRL